MVPATLFISTNEDWLKSHTLAYIARYNPEIRDWTALITHPDTQQYGAGKPMTIAEVRQVIATAAHKPYQSNYSIFILQQINQVALPAQNALLKLLEEPPPHVLLVAWASHKHTVLPTVVSRCQLYEYFETGLIVPDDWQQEILNYCSAPLYERMQRGQKLAADKNACLEFLTRLLLYYRQQLLQTPSPQLLVLERQLLQYQLLLHQQVSPKMIADMIALKLPNNPHKP